MSDTATGALPVIEAAVLDDDPFSPEMLANPQVFQERLREAGPVAYLSRYGVYAVGRYQEVRQSLSNWQDLISGRGVGLLDVDEIRGGILQLDPPQHDAPREVLQAVMSARVLKAMTDDCRQLAESLVDTLSERRDSRGDVAVDGYADIAKVFPINFFPTAAGIDEDGRENLLPYADHNFNCVGPRNELTRQGEAGAAERFQWAVDKCQRDALKPQGFGADIWAAVDRGDLLPEQAPSIVITQLNAGVDTTVYGIAGLLYALATHPDQWSLLRADPRLARVAFEEAIRWESPVQFLFRKAANDIDFSGVTVPAGSRLLIAFGAANRDPRRWADPDRFDLTRDPSGHLAFGMGIHQCVGQHAARLQAEVLLQVLAERVRTMQVTGPLGRHHNNALRGWGSIPLTWHLA